jgi:hypothetical protein
MSRNLVTLLALGTTLFLVNAQSASSQTSPAKGRVIAPPSTLGIPGVPRTKLFRFIPQGATLPLPQLAGETPASIACIYGLTKPVKGCPTNGTTAIPTG